jgi:LmbE family N-acetylglucosaminyl deacetylase
LALRLLCITAHPDDETGSFGGALMQAHARGVETSVLCLTEGRKASHRGTAKDDDELARLRRREFAAALEVLGVDHGEVLEYPDGALTQLDFLEVTAKLVERIRRFRPQVVLTFSGDGNVNLHPDHMMVSFFTTAAFHWAGRTTPAFSQIDGLLAPYRPQKLYYSTAPFLAYRTSEETQLIPLTPASLILDLGDLAARKVEAFRRHTTQSVILDRIGPAVKKHMSREGYLLAAAPGISILSGEKDMFEGVVGD